MSLSSALSIAQSALLATSRRTSVVTQNVTNADNADYTRRSAVLISDQSGIRVADIRRAANDSLLRQYLNANSDWEGQQTMFAGLDTLALAVNGEANGTSPATGLGALQESLQLYAASPSSASLADGVVNSARQLVQTLNGGTSQIQSYRAELDLEISRSVDDLNSLLAEFDAANTAVVKATAIGEDATDALDKRDAILKEISQYIPVSTQTRANNDMVVTTGDGVTLYETSPRNIAFEPTAFYSAGVEGNAVYIDGVPVTTGTGKLAAMVELRDNVAVTMQTQLDEIARGLITAFDEAGTPGLFTWTPPPATVGSLTPGLAGKIEINADFDPDAGGDPVKLRDGNSYDANPDNHAAFTGLLVAYGDNLDASMNFDPSTGVNTNSNLGEFATNTISWVEALRQTTSNSGLTSGALLSRVSETLSNSTGVNVDDQMALMLELEHSYEASARLISTIDEMMAILLEMAG
ncbi:flagellar hook-associated protein FlgK [Mesorhizobium xinjiangense]|uniref:flagellar hook-associated protein FlgK n=1 Tax=Mesorhizobium xinjiangense TaxID=2678685 RepID=UPI0012ED3AD3|nr:flagellar hook-associated protein FlgK [Mesorhizobium xinjiangense]